jgi:hypothetical protein
VVWADWTFYKSDVDLLSVIDGSTTIVGAGSLRLSNVNDKAPASNVHGFYTTNNSFTRGRIRTLIQLPSGTTRMQAGIYCMASQADLTATGSAYFACLQNDSNGGARTLQLFKFTAGFDGSLSTLDSVSHPAFTETAVVALELEWVADAAVLGGTRLIVRQGAEEDFSDLADVLDYTDVSSALVTSVGEGLALVKWDNFSNLAEARFDQTTVVPLA